jgi:predicted GNAT family acetyltransferase
LYYLKKYYIIYPIGGKELAEGGRKNMMRKLTREDQSVLLEYLLEESAINLFILGDIENFGMSTEFMDIWGAFDEKGAYQGVLLRYYDFFILYSKNNEFDGEEIEVVLKKHGKVECLSGKESTMDKFLKTSAIHAKSVKVDYYVGLRNSVNELPQKSRYETVKGTVEDVDDVVLLLNTIEEFGGMSQTGIDGMKKELEKGGARLYLVRDGHKVVATARSAAENSRSAMIVGVATDIAYRKQGLASTCMMKLCRELLGEGKEVCLFYDNPKAGSIYRALGFQDVGMWIMAKDIDL